MTESASAPAPAPVPVEQAEIAFARALFLRAGAGYAAELTAAAKAALVASAFRFFARMTAPLRARVWTPTAAAGGWDSRYTIAESHLADRPFLVDTIRMFFQGKGVAVHHLLHPIYSVERSADGSLVRIHSIDGAARRESFVHAALDPLPEESHTPLRAELEDRLHDVVLVTDDYPAMRDRLEAVRKELEDARRTCPRRAAEIDEARAFLAWLASGHLVFLGFRSETGSGLGLMRKESPQADLDRRAPDDAGGPILTITRTTAESTVHRAARMDSIAVKRLDASGRVVGEHRFLGLFTSKAYAAESAEIPVLRQKLEQIVAAEQVLPDSYDYREVVSIFDSIPKGDLFALSTDELRAEVRTLLAMGRSRDVRVTIRPDSGGATVMLLLPRERYSGEVQRDVQLLLERRFGGKVRDTQVTLGESDHARIHFYVSSPAPLAAVSAAELEAAIGERVRSWESRLRERLLAEEGAVAGRSLAERYGAFFTAEYKASTDVAEAVSDIRRLEELHARGSIQVSLENPTSPEEERFTVLKLYAPEAPLVLSDFLPLCESLGLRVFAEDAFQLGEPPALVFVHRFLVQDAHGSRLDIAALTPLLGPAILEILAGRSESDRLNRLVVDAELSWRQVECLRTVRNAAHQLGAAPSRMALTDALVRHPDSARALWDVFAASFDPALGDRPGRTEKARERFLLTLEEVETSGEDRNLRSLLALVLATVRTNYYRSARADHPYFSIKLRSRSLDFAQKPRPLYEVHVHSARMEGLHLRGGKVARGGIRWSDRPDDLRTEILGLMKTQMVKNAVIVPVGSKGGFIVKRPQPGTEGPKEVRECYSTLMRGLLDLTDNIVKGEVVPPADVVRHDDDDPYLVVAADKGTATFSDLANEISAEYGLWLGDAFASGGSQGYDHKKEAITARGAWECVKRHFHELGKDAAEDSIVVAGIGDMSGDVFGNGMLLSRKLRLRAAFNHAHVFLDPDPDPEASFRERERLFRLPRSQWTDYDRSLLSKGGAIVARTTKAAPLSPEARAMLGITAERLDGEGLVRAILAMETDLFWNGGIGTYVRASTERDADVGDPANDQVRVTAAEVRAAVVGEGGNLGFTQRARIELALRGGRINTDAIDNSGGVDLSDHEVNLKILFRPLLEEGRTNPAQRNRILEQVKQDVIAQVLAHNVRQSWLLSLDQVRSRTRLEEFSDHIADLEQEGELDRVLEALPDRDALRRRRGSTLGLTRPELAVVAAHSKLSLQRKLLASPWLEDTALERYVLDYFPPAIAERFPEAIRGHRLRREIAAAELGNRAIDCMGSAFCQRMSRDCGVDAATAAVAWAVVIALADVDRLFDAIVDSRLRAEDAFELCLRWEHAVESAAKMVAPLLDRKEPLEAQIRSWRHSLAGLADFAEAELGAAAVEEGARLERLGLPAGVARSLAALPALRATLEVARIVEDRGGGETSLVLAAAAYRAVGGLLDFAAIERWLDQIPGDDRSEKSAAEALREDVYAARRRMARAVLDRGKGDVTAGFATFAADREAELGRARSLVEGLRSARRVTIAALLVLVRELWKSAGRR